MKTHFPVHLADDELALEVERLARCAREMTAVLVAHLAEFDARRLYRGAGYPSLFAYCTDRLRLSEHATYNRMKAARAARRFPVILEMLRDGSLNLATARILAPHLTAENHQELLASASGKSKREVDELVVRHFPRPSAPPLVRKLPSRHPVAVAAAAVSAVPPVRDRLLTVEALPAVAAAAAGASGDAMRPPLEPGGTISPVSVASPARAAVTPLAPERYQIRFTASAETYQKLREAQEMLGHAVPRGDVAAVVDRALSALLADLGRKKLAATARPRPPRPLSAASPGSRHIPAHVRRSVWERDGGRCAFTAASGRRCACRRALEFHHVHPYGAGGEATVGNIELRCRSHNAYEAELFYGMTSNGSLPPSKTVMGAGPRTTCPGASPPGSSNQGSRQARFP